MCWHEIAASLWEKMAYRGLWLGVCLFCLIGPAAAENYQADAQRYFDKGEYRSAIIQLKNALLQHPDDVNARLLLGKTYLILNDGSSAIKELRFARDHGLAREQWLIPLGHAYLLAGFSKELFQEIVVRPTDGKSLRADILALHGQAYLIAGQFKDAATQFQQALDLVPNHNGALLGQIRIAIEHQDYNDAARLIDLDKQSPNPDAPATDVLSAELLRITGKPQAAIELFHKVLALRPDNVSAQLGLAASYLAVMDYPAADKILVAVHDRYPGMPQSNYLTALSQYQQHQYDRTEQALQLVFITDPDNPPGRLLHGTLNYMRGNYAEAEKSLRRYIKAVPGNVAAIKLLSVTLLKLHQPWDAVAVLQAGLQYASKDAQYEALLGSAYLRNGDSNKAMTYLEQAAQAGPEMADVRTQIAIGYLLQDNSAQTAVALQSVVAIDKDLLQADILRVLLLIKNKAYDKALPAAESFIDKRPDQPMGYNLLGAVELGRGDITAARKAFERALKVQRTFIPALLNLARLDVLAGNTADATHGLEYILALDADNMSALILLARLATRAGNNAEAVKWLEKARSSNPGAVDPSLLLVEHYLRSNEAMKALEVARQLQAAHPDMPAALAALGLAQMQANIDPSAETTLRKLVALAPKSVESYLLLAKILSKRDDPVGARQALQKVLDLQPDNIDARLELGALALKLKQADEALAIATALQTRYPNRVEGYEMAGDALMLLQDPAKAALAYQQANKYQSSGQRVVKQFKSLKAAGETNKAIAPLAAWLGNRPGDIPLRLLLAVDLQQRGNLKAAATEYEQIIRQAPSNLVALNNLAWVYQATGNGKALGIAEKVYKLAPERAEYIDTYGWMLVLAGDPKRGLELLKEAVLYAPQIAEIRYHMAYALQKNGDTQAACVELGRLIIADKESPSYQDAQRLNKQVCVH